MASLTSHRRSGAGRRMVQRQTQASSASLYLHATPQEPRIQHAAVSSSPELGTLSFRRLVSVRKGASARNSYLTFAFLQRACACFSKTTKKVLLKRFTRQNARFKGQLQRGLFLLFEPVMYNTTAWVSVSRAAASHDKVCSRSVKSSEIITGTLTLVASEHKDSVQLVQIQTCVLKNSTGGPWNASLLSHAVFWEADCPVSGTPGLGKTRECLSPRKAENWTPACMCSAGRSDVSSRSTQHVQEGNLSHAAWRDERRQEVSDCMY